MRTPEELVTGAAARVRALVKDAVGEVRAPMSPGHRQAAFLAVALAFVIVAYGAPHKVVQQDASATPLSLSPVPAARATSTTALPAPAAQPAAVPAAVPVAPLVASPEPSVSSTGPASTTPATSPPPKATTTTSTTSTTSTTTPPACAVANPLGGCLAGP